VITWQVTTCDIAVNKSHVLTSDQRQRKNVFLCFWAKIKKSGSHNVLQLSFPTDCRSDFHTKQCVYGEIRILSKCHAITRPVHESYLMWDVMTILYLEARKHRYLSQVPEFSRIDTWTLWVFKYTWYLWTALYLWTTLLVSMHAGNVLIFRSQVSCNPLPNLITWIPIADVLGKVYGVVAKQCGWVVAKEREETPLFSIQALLSVVESFGFTDGELTRVFSIRKLDNESMLIRHTQTYFWSSKSSTSVQQMGPTNQQSGHMPTEGCVIVMSCWTKTCFWVPITEEELEDFWEKADQSNVAKGYMGDHKGMFVDWKVIKYTEKQRTLKWWS